MEKMMILQKVGDLQQREFTTQNGDVRKVNSRMLMFTNGIDTIYGETSDRLTIKTESTNPQVKINLLEGHVYEVEFKLNAREYTTQQGVNNIFFSCTILDLFMIV